MSTAEYTDSVNFILEFSRLLLWPLWGMRCFSMVSNMDSKKTVQKHAEYFKRLQKAVEYGGLLGHAGFSHNRNISYATGHMRLSF